MPVIASILTDEKDRPMHVRVAHTGNAVEADPESPARAIQLALNAIGYEIDGMFSRFSYHVIHVPVRESPGSFLSYLAGERRGTTLGGLPRVLLDADLMTGVYPAMTLEEVDEYDSGDREVRIR